MHLIDLDQQIFVPVVDEGAGTSYEMQMTVAEFFDRFCEGFKPDVVDAIPVEWLYDKRFRAAFVVDEQDDRIAAAINIVLDMWQREQEAR